MNTPSEPQSITEVTGTNLPASHASCDYTKTKFYAYLDLAFKALSACALLALGLAGWQLQRRSQLEQLRIQALERQERRYLPMLRSISVFEIEAKRISEVLRTGLSRGRAPESRSVHEYSADLEFFAQAMFLPDGDPSIRVFRETLEDLKPDERVAVLPLRAAALMTSEFIQICDSLEDGSGQDYVWTLDHSNEISVKYSAFEFDLDQGGPAKVQKREYRQRLSDDSIEAWRLWLGTKGMKLDRSNLEAVGFHLLYQLRNGCARVIQNTLLSHLELGDRYIQIRAEVERNGIGGN